jgi:hypothetical protein
MKKTMNSSLARVLHQMIQIGQFWLVASWVVPFHNVGLDYQRLESLRKCMFAPCLVDLHDITQIFFEHSTCGLKIREVAREELYNFLCK